MENKLSELNEQIQVNIDLYLEQKREFDDLNFKIECCAKEIDKIMSDIKDKITEYLAKEGIKDGDRFIFKSKEYVFKGIREMHAVQVNEEGVKYVRIYFARVKTNGEAYAEKRCGYHPFQIAELISLMRSELDTTKIWML